MNSNLQNYTLKSDDHVAKKCKWNIEVPSFEKNKTLLDMEFELKEDKKNSSIILLRTPMLSFTLFFISFLFFISAMFYITIFNAENYLENLNAVQAIILLFLGFLFLVISFYFFKFLKLKTNLFFNPPYINTQDRYIKVGKKILFDDIHAIQIVDGLMKGSFLGNCTCIFIILKDCSRFQIYFNPKEMYFGNHKQKIIQNANKIANYIGVEFWNVIGSSKKYTQ